ncbi:Hypothetical predicted protein [Olea europaea subsp. europaea]|uniref:Uncharacterized protein n=1 Tax=Olea europaea subsp. europaea TaxID=158383 RepID=A0A8S0QDV5_OLEEU|nr:Hypothetical predicted protein [Olea europaea subsp. europaea]
MSNAESASDSVISTQKPGKCNVGETIDPQSVTRQNYELPRSWRGCHRIELEASEKQLLGVKVVTTDDSDVKQQASQSTTGIMSNSTTNVVTSRSQSVRGRRPLRSRSTDSVV